MPCRIPTDEAPHQCRKLAARGESEPDGNDHVWPTEGLLLVSRCEVYCWFCWESKGSTSRWKFPWHLRRHVQSVHAGKTHPKLVCSKGWKESKTGNRTPWREQGVPAPMGNYKIKPDALASKATATEKPSKTPERRPKRQARKKSKASSPKATLASDTRETTPMPSTPALTENTATAFSTPAGQLSLPGDADMGFNGVYDFSNHMMSLPLARSSMTMYGDAKSNFDDNAATMFGPELATSLNAEADHVYTGSDSATDFKLARAGSIFWDTTMSGLDLASNVVSATTNFGNITPTGYPHSAAGPTWTESFTYPSASASYDSAQPTWMAPQDLSPEGAAIEAMASPELETSGDPAHELYYELTDVVFDSLAEGKLSEGEALLVLQSFTSSFKEGKL